MIFVVLATHNAEVCPTANSKTRDLMIQNAPQMTALAQRLGVKLIAGPFVNREHISVVIVESTAEALDHYLVESHLAQWNSVRVLPSLPIEEGLRQATEATMVF